MESDDDAPSEGRFRRAVAFGFLGTAGFASVAYPLDRPALGVFLGALAVAAAVFSSRPRPIGSLELLYGCLGLLLASMPLFRDAAWVVIPCLLFAAALGSLTVAGGMGFGGTAAGFAAAAGRLHLVPGFVFRSLSGRAGAAARGFSAARAVVLTAALILLFGALLYSADAAFAHFLSELIPEFNETLVLRAFLFFAALFYAISVTLTGPRYRGSPFTGTVDAAEKLVAGFKAASDFRGRNREWMIGMTGLVVLFSAFIAVQARVMFGGDAYVQRTVGLTYSEYARQGFFQLLLVGLLTLAVLGTVRLLAVWEPDAGIRALRGLSAGLIVLTLIILGSAFYRLVLYEQAFGFTRPRLVGHAVTIWLGGVFVLILISGAFGLGRRLPVAIVVFTAAALLGFAVYNPDARIAEANIARFEKTAKVDMDYLSTLSFDAAMQLLLLPTELRNCLSIDEPLKGDWRSFNFSRSAADKLFAETGGVCTPPSGDSRPD